MKAVFIILVIAMVAKDTSQLGDRYVLRTLAQGLCLMAALGWLTTVRDFGWIRRHVAILAYLAVVFLLSVSYSSWSLLLQAGSLSAVALFAIAYAEQGGPTARLTILRTTGSVYALVCALSLAAAAALPDLAYTLDDPTFGRGLRFSGLFSEPAMMSAAAGILLLIACFGPLRPWQRLAMAAIALPCMLLTGTRTFAAAALIAAGVTAWRYYPRYRSLFLSAAALVLLVSAILLVMNFTVDTSSAEEALRVDTIGTLNGRLPLWSAAIAAWQEAPLAGYGITRGATGILELGPDLYEHFDTVLATSLQSSDQTFTLHNGYLQTLLDSGLLGLSPYLCILGIALFRLLRRTPNTDDAVLLALLIFFAMANMAESLIYSAAVYHSLFYWFLIALIFAPNSARSTQATGQPVSTMPAAPLPTFSVRLNRS